MADTGFLFPDFAEDVVSGAESAWTNLANLTAEDDAYATISLNMGQTARRIQAYDFDIGDVVPIGATIDGIEVQFSAKTSSSTVGIADVWLVDPDTGNQVGDDKGAGTVTTTEQFFTFGGATDKWNWTDVDRTQLASANFKVAIKFNTAAATFTLSVDSVQVKVYYTAAAGASAFHHIAAEPAFFSHVRR
jgi:hypothetical protein